MFRFARVTAVVLCVGLALGMTACGKKAAEPPPAAAPVAAVSVTAVELGRSIGGDKRVTDKTDQFKPNDMIYASVLTSGTSSSASLKARWTFQDGQVVDESEQSIAPTGDAVTEFHISKPNGWPAGKYKVEVSLNGVPAQTKDFEVK
jgi:hypothetical protein